MKISKFIKQNEKYALDNNKESAAVILLLEHILNMSPTELFINMENEISDEDMNRFNTEFDKYINHNIPIQHIIGYSTFYGYDFIVNDDVLIPRRETEELVENILYRYDQHFKGQKIDVCDLCSGSGNIAVTLSCEEPNMNVYGTDISPEAIEVAKKNNEKLGGKVKFLVGDMLEPVKGMKFDIFISNPPYIPQVQEVDSLVKDNEPNIALFGGEDGLKFYRIILSGVKDLIKDKAMICFEHGYEMRESLHKIIKENLGDDVKIETLKDLEGKDRMTFIYVGDFKW